MFASSRPPELSGPATSSNPPVVFVQNFGASDDDRVALAQYLSGEVAIGINGILPGWSKSSSPNQASGFDVALIEYLRKKYDFTPKYDNLRPWEREGALENGRVKLVVANYSMTPERDQSVDFAGPYFP